MLVEHSNAVRISLALSGLVVGQTKVLKTGDGIVKICDSFHALFSIRSVRNCYQHLLNDLSFAEGHGLCL